MKLIKWTTALAVTLALGTATTAEAAPVTVGSPLTGVFTPVPFNAVGTIAITALPEAGAHVTSPVSGVITSWHVLDASGGPFKLRVLRPSGGGYLGAGSSSPVVPSGGGLQTFQTSLPIQAGDVVAIDNSNKEDEIGAAGVPGAAFSGWVPPLADGATAPPNIPGPDTEVAFNAIVQPAPTLTSISPASGSIKGGTTVTVSGTDFANVSGVSFGGIPASSFSVANEGQITAVAPAVKKAGAVDVTVATIAGTTPVVATDKFTYKACVVPQLKGKKLKAAKRKLRKARCKVGKVKLRGDAIAKTGKVVKQAPKPGKQLAPGSKVNVTLG